MVELIKKKRNGQALSADEISHIVDGFVSGDIPDYQISAFMMAVYFKGMNHEETAILTDRMMRSGDLIDLKEISGIKVDKHSTGGVGDKTTLILAPLVAAAGAPVAKMSGRGLGHTGGTLDKLESIAGLSVSMSREEFIEKIKKYNIAICGQNRSLVPADKKLYALRDVTATVDNISLIASSIMSKKLACGADAIVIDIKVGNGAYMKDVQEARQLADVLIGIGQNMGRKVRAVITSMYEPLGRTVGNALEVKEAIATLKGKGPRDLTELCLELGSHMLVLGGISSNKSEARQKLKHLIESGEAFAKFKELVEMQGGDISMIEDPNLLPSSKYTFQYRAKEEGYIHQLRALDIGLASVKLGAGRATKESQIDFGAGIILHKKVGDFVHKDDILATLYSNDEAHFKEAISYLDAAYAFHPHTLRKKALILDTII